jgi:XTP/dITP diphosphohydrolase
MNRLLVATRSPGKQTEFRRLLRQFPFELVFPDDVGLAESAAEELLEVHDSFAANARAKAAWFAGRTQLPTLADDSGLEVAALDDAPGVRSRRYSGVTGPESDVSLANNRALLDALADLSESDRKARYRCALVLHTPGRDEIVSYGVVEGSIAAAARGSNGFGYDPIFVSSELGRTFGEATVGEKEAISHRARAVAALAARAGWSRP